MQHLEVSGPVRPLYSSLGVKREAAVAPQAPACRLCQISGAVTPLFSPSQPPTLSRLNFLHCFLFRFSSTLPLPIIICYSLLFITDFHRHLCAFYCCW